MNVKRFVKCLSAATLLVVSTATCSRVTGSSSDSELDFLEKSTASFVFVYTKTDVATIDALAADMEAKLARLKAKMHVTTLPKVTVVLYPNHRTFAQANPSDFWVPAVTRGTSRIEMVSPYAPNQVYDLWPDTRAEHMIAHIVALGVNNESGNNPRWLWESLALWESGQKGAVQQAQFFKPGASPALSQLGGGYGTPIFDVGYYLGEFLEETYGVDKIIELIKAEGNLPATLGLSGDQFIAAFVSYVRTKYNLPTQ